MADIHSKEHRRKNMQAVRSKATKIELQVSKALWHHGVRLRKNVKDLFGKPDFALKKYKIVIFIDSCFWHGCEEHRSIPKTNEEFWMAKINRNKERDNEVDQYYFKEDWNLLRIWEHDLKNDFDYTIQKIIDFIDKSKNKAK
ncbi:very short patch repair endonuclease [Paenibacillus sp. J31TS4]|uniref:very short patch repair endonuclease n=1 Tax=Paenibacillus sp. J31TS4 TaxID=2807195 RepID=UPI001B012396|nr:very short patch repair endonuclease [Paenibacillus sp. J31TS4]GIP38444.1 very short patch repair endonuclease [Paenibacillus sp. J31TS4]